MINNNRRQFIKGVGATLASAALSPTSIAASIFKKAGISSVYDLTSIVNDEYGMLQFVQDILYNRGEDQQQSMKKASKIVAGVKQNLQKGILPRDPLVRAVLFEWEFFKQLKPLLKAASDQPKFKSLQDFDIKLRDAENWLVEGTLAGEYDDFVNAVKNLMPAKDVVYNGQVVLSKADAIAHKIFKPDIEILKNLENQVSKINKQKLQEYQPVDDDDDDEYDEYDEIEYSPADYLGGAPEGGSEQHGYKLAVDSYSSSNCSTFEQFYEHFLTEAKKGARCTKATGQQSSTRSDKKYSRCVKTPTGFKRVHYGDPNLRIKKSNPARRKSFRARHKCSQKKDKTKPGYWSCKNW